MATPATTPNQALCQIVPVYSTEQAQSVRIWLQQMVTSAKWTECSTIMFEFIPATASACREVLGPMRIKPDPDYNNGTPISLQSRVRRLEDGFVMWVPPWPPDRQPAKKREVKVYEPAPKQQPKTIPGAEEWPSDGAEEIDSEPEANDAPDETGEEAPPQPPQTPPANPARVRSREDLKKASRPKGLSYKGVKLDEQQPVIGEEEDLSGGGKITRVRPKPSK